MAEEGGRKAIREIGEIATRSGQRFGRMWRVRVEPGMRTLWRHSHTQFEMTLVTEGSGVYTLSSGPVPMAPGDMFVFASREVHCITEVGPAGLEIMNFHLEPRLFMAQSGELLGHPDFCFAHGPSFPGRIPASAAGPLREAFLGLETELLEKKPECALLAAARVNALAALLLRDYGYAGQQDGCTEPQLPGILRAMAYIEDHLSEPLTLEKIAAEAGISPNYFSTLFRRFCGVTLWEHVQTKRIELAIRLLRSGEKQNILEIALACGFNNTANFNKAFRRHTGVTPSYYRSVEDRLLN